MSTLFDDLSPDRVLDLVEDVLGVDVLSVCHPLASYINRVYEVPLADGDAVIAKFYRPGRWGEDAILDEHEFIFELEDADLPVVAPLTDDEDISLFSDEELWFSLYPRKRGRPFEDPDDQRLQELGRTLARMHTVGDAHQPEHRITWDPAHATQRHLNHILSHATFPASSFGTRLEEMGATLISEYSDAFTPSQFTRLHGDCHIANLMLRPDQSGIYLIDFDDMAWGPPVQDLWMLLPGNVDQSRRELDHLLYGYTSLRPFPMQDLGLVEVLRAMRLIHFTAWCVQQQQDQGTRRLADDFGSEAWWGKTLNDLDQQMAVLRTSME